jgi:hypothetical protein
MQILLDQVMTSCDKARHMFCGSGLKSYSDQERSEAVAGVDRLCTELCRAWADAKGGA